jgi:hypothetical protein
MQWECRSSASSSVGHYQSGPAPVYFPNKRNNVLFAKFEDLEILIPTNTGNNRNGPLAWLSVTKPTDIKSQLDGPPRRGGLVRDAVGQLWEIGAKIHSSANELSFLDRDAAVAERKDDILAT